MEWIYFSPHLDDVALSLGGLLWEQSKAGLKVSIWSICAGDPPPGDLSRFAQSLHDRWQTGPHAMDERRKEDILSCEILGAKHEHFSIPDCIYRRSPNTGEPLYDSEESLWGPVHPDEKPLIEQLSQKIKRMLPSEANIVCPLTLGNHVDHHLTRLAVALAFTKIPENNQWTLFYYADYPYVLKEDFRPQKSELESHLYHLSDPGIVAWQEAILQHKSQVSTFWKDEAEARAAIRAYYDRMGGIWLGEK